MSRSTAITALSAPVKIALNAAEAISGLLDKPDRARALFVFAHGAGAGMNHRSMGAIAAGLSQRGIATLRYQFLYMEKGGRRPDPPALAHAAVRAAVAEAARLAPGLPLIAGGRSFGGRMTSQAQAAAPLPGVKGLAFLAFPLHPAGEPGIERAAHLRDVHIPMLFLQGARDALADLALLRPMIDALDPRATLKLIEHADHSFTVPAKSGRTNAEAETELLDALAEWIARIAAA
jgi:predicted alpha/beta-hydrolase family hydrolase